jgi:hypothetical protein
LTLVDRGEAFDALEKGEELAHRKGGRNRTPMALNRSREKERRGWGEGSMAHAQRGVRSADTDLQPMEVGGG